MDWDNTELRRLSSPVLCVTAADKCSAMLNHARLLSAKRGHGVGKTAGGQARMRRLKKRDGERTGAGGVQGVQGVPAVPAGQRWAKVGKVWSQPPEQTRYDQRSSFDFDPRLAAVSRNNLPSRV
ncbi:hypothetical protein ANO11243_021280 [Dothideomycetidae sp. 11243]|nr:hypothetical protein ANO11243_021280 [fungal sp. No.11243]